MLLHRVNVTLSARLNGFIRAGSQSVSPFDSLPVRFAHGR